MIAPNSTLKLAIFDSGLTQLQVADKAGVHESRLSKIIRGHLQPTDDEKKNIAKVLKKRVDELFSSEAA